MVKRNRCREDCERDPPHSIGFNPRLSENGKPAPATTKTGKRASSAMTYLFGRTVSEKLFRWLWRVFVLATLIFLGWQALSIRAELQYRGHQQRRSELGG